MGIEGLIIGAITHFVLPAGRSMGQHRAAIITNIWDEVDGIVDLTVFIDGSEDGYPYNQPAVFFNGVQFSETKENGTWHWLESWAGPMPPDPVSG